MISVALTASRLHHNTVVADRPAEAAASAADSSAGEKAAMSRSPRLSGRYCARSSAGRPSQIRNVSRHSRGRVSWSVLRGAGGPNSKAVQTTTDATAAASPKAMQTGFWTAHSTAAARPRPATTAIIRRIRGGGGGGEPVRLALSSARAT
jgi:hypothetical protein